MNMRLPFQGEHAITMHFGDKAKWFTGGKHLGVDWAIKKVPLLACFSGTITVANKWQMNGYGRQVNIKSSDGIFEAIYGHLSDIQCKVGDKVLIGQRIGISGNSGFVISLGGGGFHLHFGLKKNGAWVDPLQYIDNPLQGKILEVKEIAPITTGYIVKKGESLSSIARDFYKDARKWQKIYDANKKVIGQNPNFLKIGIVLIIPGQK